MPKKEDTLTEEERLQALLYQYLALYERWSEDRQVAAKRGADHAELLRQFSAQVAAFKALAPAVRQDILESLRAALSKAVVEESKPLQDFVQRKLQQLLDQLEQVVYKAQDTLSAYHAAYVREVQWLQWKVLGGVVVTAVCVSFLALKLLVPAVVGPTDQEMHLMEEGQISRDVFSQMTSKEQERWMALVTKVLSEERPRARKGRSESEG